MNASSPPRSDPDNALARFFFRWIKRILLVAISFAAFIYLGDFATFYVRGKPLDQVTVTDYLATPLKGNKMEYDIEGIQPVSCSRSLFPQAGWLPCWYLRKHHNRADQL
jgi:hypothetical protein